MTLDEYQSLAQRTAGDMSLAYQALKLNGEAGECADLIGKHIGQGHALDLEKLEKELGDTLWHLAMLARAAGLSLERVAQTNIGKLKARYPEGFEVKRSVFREDPEPKDMILSEVQCAQCRAYRRKSPLCPVCLSDRVVS